MENVGESPMEPVTALIVRNVKPGCFAEFEEWAKGMNLIARKYEGFLGANVIRPRDAARPEFVIVVRHDTYDHLKAFMNSDEREEYKKKSDRLTVGDISVQEMHGFDSFFSLPDSNHPNPPISPAKYKIAILTILALYIPLLGISSLVASLFHGLPRPVLVLFTLLIMVPLMTYFIMPWTTMLFRSWLFPKADNQRL